MRRLPAGLGSFRGRGGWRRFAVRPRAWCRWWAYLLPFGASTPNRTRAETRCAHERPRRPRAGGAVSPPRDDRRELGERVDPPVRGSSHVRCVGPQVSPGPAADVRGPEPRSLRRVDVIGWVVAYVHGLVRP